MNLAILAQLVNVGGDPRDGGGAAIPRALRARHSDR
jgi:hypothetical protein